MVCVVLRVCACVRSSDVSIFDEEPNPPYRVRTWAVGVSRLTLTPNLRPDYRRCFLHAHALM